MKFYLKALIVVSILISPFIITWAYLFDGHQGAFLTFMFCCVGISGLWMVERMVNLVKWAWVE